MMGRGDGYGNNNAYANSRGAIPMNPHMTGAHNRHGTGTHRAACCFVGCTAFFGPALLIAGIILLTYPNDRIRLIREYNARGIAYNATGVFSWSEGNRGRIDGRETETSFEAVRCEGDEADVESFTSYAASVAIPFDELIPDDTEEDSTVLRFQLNGVIPFTRVVTPTVARAAVMMCNDKHGCTVATMTAQCAAMHGESHARYDGTGCLNTGACGVCRFPLYLERYCAVATPIVPLPPENEGYAESDTYRSCLFPFTDADQQQQYSPEKPDKVHFRVLMAHTDPFLALQQLTHGSADFGVSVYSIRHAGTSLAAIGGVMIGVMICTAWLLRRSVRRSRLTGFETDSDDDSVGGGASTSAETHASNIKAIRQSMRIQRGSTYQSRGGGGSGKKKRTSSQKQRRIDAYNNNKNNNNNYDNDDDRSTSSPALMTADDSNYNNSGSQQPYARRKNKRSNVSFGSESAGARTPTMAVGGSPALGPSGGGNGATTSYVPPTLSQQPHQTSTAAAAAAAADTPRQRGGGATAEGGGGSDCSLPTIYSNPETRAQSPSTSSRTHTEITTTPTQQQQQRGKVRGAKMADVDEYAGREIVVAGDNDEAHASQLPPMSGMPPLPPSAATTVAAQQQQQQQRSPRGGGIGTTTAPPSQHSFVPPKPIHGFEVPLRFSKSNFLAGGGSTTPLTSARRARSGSSGAQQQENTASAQGQQQQYVIPPAAPERK